MRHACLILNPNSGANRNRAGLRASLESWATAAGLRAIVHPTDRPGHARQIAEEAAGRFDCVVAVGGDGTVNEVACGARASGVPVGIVPCGSGNGLARHLRIPLNPRAALATIASGRIRAIDSGLANGHRFFTAMGVGLDAEICWRFNQMEKRGFARYVSTGIRTFLGYKPESYTIDVPEGTTQMKAYLITIANTDQYGNNARIAPGARVDDGVLDLVALQPRGLLASLGIALRLFNGSIDRARGVARFAAPRFRIRRENGGIIHVDGETRTTGAIIEVTVDPGSLAVIVPD